MPFRLRLTLLFAGLAILLFATVSLAIYFSFTASLEEELDRKLVPRGESMAVRIEILGDQVSAPPNFGKSGMEGRLEAVFSPEGKVLLAAQEVDAQALAPDFTLLIRLSSGQRVVLNLRSDEGTALRVVYFPLVGDGTVVGVLASAVSRESADQSEASLRTSLLLANLVLLFVSLLVGMLLARSVLRPVERMRRVAEQISLQDLQKRLAYSGPRDELFALAQTFDSMLERLDQAVRQDKAFFAESSHELRTPLTVIQGNIELALRDPFTPAEELRATLQTVKGETEGMARIVADLLFLARSDAQALELVQDDVPLRVLVEETAARLVPLAREKGVTLEVESGEEAAVRGDRGLLARMLRNLGENGVRYNHPGGWVRFRLTRRQGEALLVVEDIGLGIPAEELPHLFTRFFRGVEAKRQDPRGTGLGLAIVAEITRRHGGRVEVESRLGEGSCFTVHLPRIMGTD
ncbi:MAG: ATP-binding protein [Coprothermobacterota bacterium]|nr:ATP-binding protein [Coprothermobacterota bacterium]